LVGLPFGLDLLASKPQEVFPCVTLAVDLDELAHGSPHFRYRELDRKAFDYIAEKRLLAVTAFALCKEGARMIFGVCFDRASVRDEAGDGFFDDESRLAPVALCLCDRSIGRCK
jgi:hypothetical protein